ncbi:MAG TPA: HD domain-containing protein [Candidatus Eremiobacteraeota bacterium]|nr:MAG: GTP pyrophosphokinase [bacterium ADurb.Bin363]HPZ09076.1 HD domain-containing protein [Candidatus Eremiobacteraeota bacterium]
MNKDIVFDALEFAVKAHRGQYRKGTNVPYIVHPIGVGKILIDCDCTNEVVVAGFLHDTVEDTPVTIEDIKKAFGEYVAFIVKSVSEPDKSDTWENRKKHTIEISKTAPLEVLLVEIADKLDNIKGLREACITDSMSVWNRFKRGKEKQEWYYRTLSQVLTERLKQEPGLTLARQFASEVEWVFKE